MSDLSNSHYRYLFLSVMLRIQVKVRGALSFVGCVEVLYEMLDQIHM